MPVGSVSAEAYVGSSFRYPNPFFDIASTYIPPTVKLLFQYTKYFYYSNSTISPIIYKLAEYPITSILYEKSRDGDDVNDKTKELWRRLMEDNLHIQRLQIEINLDYYVYGNAFISISYPFIRNLECPKCKKKTVIAKMKWKWKNFNFLGDCPQCKAEQVAFKVVDVPIRNRSQISICRWNPINIDIDYNALTGKSTYIYHIIGKDRKCIMLGKPDYLETVPWLFVEAVRDNKDIVLERSNLFHFRRACLSDADMGWGMPVILPVIKDAYYAQILRKGQEAVALEHIVPLRVLFPSQNADATPYVSVNLGTWRQKIEEEIKKWRQDPNYISIMPIPLGVENIGGDAKALTITPELKLVEQQIAGGLGVPLEFIMGGLNWTGSSITLRILENHFLTIIKFHDEFLEWLTTRMSRYFKIPKIRCRQANFKMADDMQYKQLVMSMQQAGNVSASTVLAENNLNFREEQEEIKKEMELKNQLMGITQIQNAEIQGQMMLIQAKYQALAQIQSQSIMNQGQEAGVMPSMGQPGQPGGGDGMPPQQPGAKGKPAQKAKPSGGPPGQAEADQMSPQQMTIPQMVETYAKQIMGMPPEQQQSLIAQMEQSGGQMPELAAAVKQYIAQAQKGVTNMKPLPEQKPPRRKPALV
jgi:hypothetical protein